jgi:hypothetical protein
MLCSTNRAILCGRNNLVHHLWWHRAMFHMERRELDAI